MYVPDVFSDMSPALPLIMLHVGPQAPSKGVVYVLCRRRAQSVELLMVS